ncbi:YdaS family helix-turn-helix protein [Bradyrhizobium sp. USDA 4452]
MVDPVKNNPFVAAAIAACGGKQSLLAERLGCAQQTVSKLLLCEIDIDPTWAVRIDKATDGVVPATKSCPALARIVKQVPEEQGAA